MLTRACARGSGHVEGPSILTLEYVLDHKPTVQFFNSEDRRAALPNRSYCTFRPRQTSSECDVAPKDPPGWFALQIPSIWEIVQQQKIISS